jgi:UDP-N-acetylglucosamine 2-epimerase (non-hydrolysing)
MKSKSIACIVGARPNFVKMAPHRDRIRPILVHTGQHYDEQMSSSFFAQLGLPAPDVHLEAGSGTQGEQTAKVLVRYESWLLNGNPLPAATVVVGDVNSTVACALASVKLGIPVIHVEAGLRSFDRTMPEEINRVLTDAISDLFLVSEPAGVSNLRAEGRPEKSIKLVGNVMIDTLLQLLPIAQQRRSELKLLTNGNGYILWTMHRPSNVDDPQSLNSWMDIMQKIAQKLPVIFPVHPRTRARLESSGSWQALEQSEHLLLSPPLGYLECLSLSSQARIVVTDSGGLQEESSVLGIPCLTLRENTERPITVSEGTSTLVGCDTGLLYRLVDDVLAGRYKKGCAISNWDGKAAERIVSEILQFLT